MSQICRDALSVGKMGTIETNVKVIILIVLIVRGHMRPSTRLAQSESASLRRGVALRGRRKGIDPDSVVKPMRKVLTTLAFKITLPLITLK